MPTLVHDGTPVIESTLICEYLDETFPDPPLMPKDPAERARMRLWSKFVDEGLFDGATELSFSAMFRERMRNMPPELREKRFPMSATRAAPTASNRPTSMACIRRSCCTPSPPTSGRSS